MKPRRNLLLGSLVVIAFGAASSAHAANATWDGSQNTGTWSDTANWSASPVPGTGNTATFSGAGGTVDVIDLGLGVTINTLLFDTSSVAAYTIGSGAVNSQTLTLNNGGAITANSTINANQIFNAALVLGTDAMAQSYTITNSDTSNTLTFAGTIAGGIGGTAGIKTLNVNTAGSGERVIINGAITAGGATAIALTKTGTGTLRLNGVNTLGDVAVNDGTLFTENNMTFGNLSVASGKTFQFGAQNAVYTININGLSGAGTVTTANSGGNQRNLILGNNNATADFSGVITQSGNRPLVLTKLGNGTQTLSGSTANTQAGGTGVGFDTYVSAGSLVLNKTAAIALPGDVFINGGTLQLSGTGDNQIADAAAVSWSSGAFDLNGRSETIGALTVSVLSASANQINVAAGKTFTAAGNVNIFNSAATTLGTSVTFNSAGSVPTSTFAVTGASSFIFGQDSTTSSTTRTNTLDMRNLGVFNAGTSGTALTNFVVGNYVQATGSNYNDGGINTAYLAPSSTIYSTAFGVGDRGTGVNPGQYTNTLYLGSGTTAIHATTITVGEVGAISTGSTVKWDTGVTSGSLTLNGTGATSAVTNMYVGYKTDTASSGAGNRLGTVDLSNGTVTGSITNLYVGYKGAIGDSGTGSPTTTGVFKLGAGTAGALSNLTIGTLTLGSSGQTAGRDNPTNGTFQLDGGTVNVTGDIVLTNENTLDTRTGTLTINGGTLTIGGNITAGITKATSTLTLSGGTLDMSGGLIGTLANPIDTFTINPGTAATLKNVASINGTAGITKTGAGILTVDGANTFTGDTLISAGKVALANTLALQYSAYDTTGSTGAIGLNVTGFTTPTLGGLKGSVNLATAITGYGSVTSLILNPQTGATPSYAGIIANGAAGMTLVKNGAGTQTLTNANSYSGGTTISEGILAVSTAGGLGSGNITNNATLNLTAGGVTYTGLSNTGVGALSGNGTVNVTLGTGTASTLLNGNYSSFTGTMNIGTGALAGAGKVQANGADNAAATYNVLNHGTLYITTGGTRNADLTLGGGNTGESLGQLRIDTNAVNWAGAITLTGSVTGTGDFTFGGGSNLTISGGIGESGGSQVLKKGGAGALIIASAASYSGTTTISAGTLQIGNAGTVGTLGSGAVANAGTLAFNRTDTYTLGSGNLVTGAGTVRLNSGTVAAAVDNQFNTTGSLTFGGSAGATTVAGLDLSSGSSTFASMLVQTDSSTANTLAIGTGKTLQINGAVTVGYNSAATSATKLTATGLGTLSIGTSVTPTNANVQIGNGQTDSFSNGASLDMSGLSTFYANLGTGTFRVGDPANGTGTGTAGSTLILAADSTIQAATLTTDSPSGSITNAIKLGSDTNIFNVNTLTVGGNAGRSNGTLTFNTGTGTLKVRSQTDPVNGRATLNVGSVNFGTGLSQTGNVFNTNGHSADLYFGTMTIGSRGDGPGTTGGTFSFDTGTLDANALVVGNRAAGADGTATTTGIVNLGGGLAVFNSTAGPVQLGTNASTTVGSTATGTLNVSGGTVTVAANAGNSFRLGYSSVAGGTANGTINLTDGTLTVAGDIIRGDATGTSTATLNLDGGTLDMGGNEIGGSVPSSNLTSLTFASGTLKNVAEINNGDGLNKTTTGTLVLDGTNSYTGDTTVSEGTLVLASTSAAGTSGIDIVAATLASLKIMTGVSVSNNITFSNTNSSSSVVREVGAGLGYDVGTTGVLKSLFAADSMPDTTAEILDGTNSGGSTTDLTMKFSTASGASNDAIRRTDIFTLNGVTVLDAGPNPDKTDTFVIQLSAAGLATDSVLGWNQSGTWVNAVAGNTGGTASFISGAWNNTYTLGTYGFDSGTSSVWAVVNHTGSFAAIPEPTSALAGLLITAGLLRRRRAAA